MSEKVEGGLEVVAEAYNHRSRDSMQVTVINIRQIGRLREGDKLVRQSDAERALAEQKALTRTAAGFDLPGMLETIKRLESELQLEREMRRKTWRQLEQVMGLLREQRDILATWRDEGFGDVWVARIEAALAQQAEPSEPKCRTCRDVGIIGHSTICPECADTWSPPVEQAEPAPAQDERLSIQCPPSHPADSYKTGTHVVHASLVHGLIRQHDRIVAALTRPAQTAPQPALYTCIGKGGEYELIGRATTAGVLKVTGRFADEVIVYRDTESNALYCREPGDFRLRMARAALSAQGGDA